MHLGGRAISSQHQALSVLMSAGSYWPRVCKNAASQGSMSNDPVGWARTLVNVTEAHQ